MKLEFDFPEQQTSKKELLLELGLAEFLQSFSYDLPLLPFIKLSPLEPTKALNHFRELDEIIKKQNLDQILVASKELPFLDNILSFFRDQMLEQAQLYLLTQYLVHVKNVHHHEKSKLPSLIDKMLSLLQKYFTSDFKSLQVDRREQKVLQEINELDKKVAYSLQKIEQKVFKDIGHKIIYPYGKELLLKSAELKTIKKCPHVSVTKDGHIYRLQIVPDTSIEQFVNRRNLLLTKYQEYIASLLKTLNQKLAPFYADFLKLYQERKQKSFLYVLANASLKHHYTIPHSATSLKLTAGILPILAKQQEKSYVPLTLDLSKGGHVLFGSNMTGKTTVLKTLFFHLCAVQFGLPVPAKSFSLPFPHDVELLLKSSGKLNKNLSSFGEEIDFFARHFAEQSYVLVDELFHTTNPLSGAELSKIFLQYFTEKNLVFFCTSQYPEVLSEKGIQLYRMQDSGHQVEKIDWNLIREGKDKGLIELNRPLHLALDFKLPEELKIKIRKTLNKNTKRK